MRSPNDGDLVSALNVEHALKRILGDTQHWNEDEALNALRAIKRARIELDEILRKHELQAAREAFEHGARWIDLADAVGVTRQTAQATYRDRLNRPRQRRQPSARDNNSWPLN